MEHSEPQPRRHWDRALEQKLSNSKQSCWCLLAAGNQGDICSLLVATALTKPWAHRCSELKNWDRCSSNAKLILHTLGRQESHCSCYLFCPWSLLSRGTAELHFRMKEPQPGTSTQAWNPKVTVGKPAVAPCKDNDRVIKKFQLVPKSNRDFKFISIQGFMALLCLNTQFGNPEKVVKLITSLRKINKINKFF